MYADDCPKIAEFARQSPQNLFRVGLFVQMTINQHFEHVPAMVERFDTLGLPETGFMGWQVRAVSALLADQEGLYKAFLGWRRHGKNAPFYAIRDIVEFPGFGIVKSAFFAQLVLPWTNVGCLDRHNLRLSGLSERTFERVPTTADGLSAKIRTYLGLCKELGGSQKLWDSWCAHVSRLRPKVFLTPDHVSKLHVACIVR